MASKPAPGAGSPSPGATGERSSIELPAGSFEVLFPFHLALDRKLRIIQFGRQLGPLLPELSVGDRMSDHFGLVRPGGVEPSWRSLLEHLDGSFVFAARKGGLALRGQVLPKDQATLLFLASPWVTGVDELQALGLDPTDLPIHDRLAECLELLADKDRALRRTQAMAERLDLRRRELRMANRELGLQHRAIMVLAEGSTLTDGAERLMEAIGGATGWEAGAWWVPQEDASILCQTAWVADHADFAKPLGAALIGDDLLPSPVGLRAMRSSEFQWCRRTSAEGQGTPERMAASLGLEVSLALPIGTGEDDVGVLQFFGKSPNAPDAGLLRVLEDVGTWMSEFERRRRVEAAITLARQEAEEASRVKGDFIAMMSHEIRTPMNGVIGMSEILLETPLTDEQRDYADTIRKSGDALLTIIDDILDFSKVESGHLEFTSDSVNLRDTIEDTCALVGEAAATKGLVLVASVNPEVRTERIGDPSRLRQILINLVGNALKFTDEGEVIVRVVPTPGDDDELVRFEVEDTGVGIPEASLDRLFEPFYRGPADRATVRRGTGLGLAISAQLAESMGGRIGVESTLGVGTCSWFTARLPVRPAAVDPISQPIRSLQGRRALVVDGSGSRRTALSQWMTAWGLDVTTVQDADLAREAITSATNSDLADVILVDFPLAGTSEGGLVVDIRANPALVRVPVVLLTPFRERRRMPRPGQLISHLLKKPIRSARLRSALIGLLGPAGEVEQTPLHPMVAPLWPALRGNKPTILLAEDDRTSQRVVELHVKKLGCAVHTVDNGKDAVSACISGNYDLVLMDCQMPGLDGLAATRAIRAAEEGKHTPIVALTAHTARADAAACLEAGMDAWLSKPIRFERLREALDQWLRRGRRETTL